jgi:glycosyltransferase involved in cell wall biosynthesis
LNTGDSIEIALLSVAGQTYPNIEHIIVDGASKDKTLPTIRKHQKSNKNIRLLTEKDQGIYDAMNKGMDLCTGDWIIFLGADDAFANENILMDLYEQGLFQEEHIVYGNVILKGDAPWAKDGTIYDGPFSLEKLFKVNICHQCILYPKSVIRQIGHYDTRYKVTSDWDYNFRCWARYKFTYIDKIIAVFATGGKSSEGGDYQLHLDFPENIINYFHLDVNDGNLYLATSEFYYPMTRHKENEYLRSIQDLKAETGHLKELLGTRQTEHEESVAVLQADHGSSDAILWAEFDQVLADLKADQKTFLASYRTENERNLTNVNAAHNQAVASIREEHDLVIANINEQHRQVVENIKTEHHLVFDSIKAEHEQVVSNLKYEHEQVVVNLKNEHQQVVSNLRNENEQVVSNLRNENEQVVSNLRAENEYAVKFLTEKHEQVIADLNKEHVQSIANLNKEQAQGMANQKDEHLRNVANLKDEHNLKVTSLKSEHVQSVSLLTVKHSISVNNLKTEHNLAVSNLKLEHGLLIAALKTEQLESMNTLKNNYEDIVRTLQSEQRASMDAFRLKEAEFMHYNESNVQQINNLNDTISRNTVIFNEMVEKYNREIANLKETIFARNHEIATIYKSYTWKTGKILLAPAVFLATRTSKKSNQ